MYLLLAVLVEVLTLYTSWYVGYFILFFAMIMVLVAFGCCIAKGQIKVFFSRIIECRLEILIAIILFGTLMIPFFMLYIPILRSAGGYDYMGVAVHLPEIIDIINVTESNFMMGEVLKRIGTSMRVFSSEQQEGFSVILLVMFAIAYVKTRKALWNQDNGEVEEKYFWRYVVSVSIMICLLLIVRLGSNGISLWRIVSKIVPGATSIRAISRFMFFWGFPMVAVTSCCLDDIFIKRNSIPQNVCRIVIITLLVISNINLDGIYTTESWNAKTQQELLDSIPPAPDDMETFFICDLPQDQYDTYWQTMAMEISDKFEVPTINGYPGVSPENWGLIRFCRVDYV